MNNTTKYDWSKIQKTHNWATVDADGRAFAHSDEPKRFSYGFRAITATHQSIFLGIQNSENWKQSLEKRKQ